MTDDKHEALAMPDSVSDRLRRMVLWLMATDRRKRPQSVAEIRRVLNQKTEEKPEEKPADAGKGEAGDDVTVVLPKSGQNQVVEDPAANGETGNASSDNPSAASDSPSAADDDTPAASDDPSTTDNPYAADDETEIVQDDPSVEVEEKKSSKWKWILVILIFAVIGFFGAKYFLSPGQDTAPATSEPDSVVVDSTVVVKQQTPAADQQQAPAAPAATGKTNAAPEAAAAHPAPKKTAPKHKKPSQKKSGRQYHYDYDEPYRPSTPSKNPTSGGSESYGSGSGKNPSYGSSSTSSSKKENTAGDSSW